MIRRRSENSLLEPPDAQAPPTETILQTPTAGRTALAIRQSLLFLLSVTFFILALILVKEGARPLGSVLRSSFSVQSPLSALGFGWLLSSLILSGSPVAAIGLTLLDADILTVPESFSMVAGSRLGASFIVLLIGFVYLLRGRQTAGSLSAGLLSLLVTQLTYIPAMALGLYLLRNGWVTEIRPVASDASAPPMLQAVFGPLSDAVVAYLPDWGIFPTGFLLMLFSFWLFDQVIPDLHLEHTSLGRVNRLLYRPLVTFALGAAVTAITMSVSVSLGLLVPLSVRGYIRKENMIPYMMGANITTFIDTLFAAAILANPNAISVVVAHMASVTVVSLLLLILGFRLFERGVSALVVWLEADRLRLSIYVLGTLLVPLVLLLAF